MDFLGLVDCAGDQKINCCYARKIRKHISVIAQEVDRVQTCAQRCLAVPLQDRESLVVELQRKVSHYLQPILSHRFLNNLA